MHKLVFWNLSVLCVEGIPKYWHTLQLPFLGWMMLDEGSG